MNERFDLLESELRQLPSRGISPRLRREVARQLEAPPLECSPWPPIQHSAWNGSASLAAALAAACMIAVLLWRTGGNGTVALPTDFAPSQNDGDTRPTVQVYRRALARSPGSLETLFDKHSARTLPHSPAASSVQAFARFEDTNDFLGEL